MLHITSLQTAGMLITLTSSYLDGYDNNLNLKAQVNNADLVSKWDDLTHNTFMKASNTGSNDSFGFAISVSGQTLAVGSYGEKSGATGIGGDQLDNSKNLSGAVYVFSQINGQWVQEAYIKASNTDAFDRFGSSVSISDDTLVVGAPGEDSAATGINSHQFNNAAIDSGAAYVFVKENGTWSQQAYLKASNTEANDWFGTAVEIVADTLVISAINESSNATGADGDQNNNLSQQSGAAYVFTRNMDQWQQSHYLKPFDTSSFQHLGDSVALTSDTLALGSAWKNIGNSINQGVVYVYQRSGSDWFQAAYLTASNGGSGDNFGHAIDLNADTLAVTARRENGSGSGIDPIDDNNAENSGAVYVFGRPNGDWIEQAYIKPSNTGEQDQFGWSVSLYEDSLVIGSYLESSDAVGINGDGSNNNEFESGASYLFSRAGNQWFETAYIKASNTGAGDNFGVAVALDQHNIFVGAHLEDSSSTGINGSQDNDDSSGSGAVYIFQSDLIFNNGFQTVAVLRLN